jgi:pimeloyl-ACP methyl ester carboxylesterase
MQVKSSFAVIGWIITISCAEAQDYPSTDLTELDGSLVRVSMTGFEDRSPGEIAVILQSGAGQALEHWDTVLGSIAEVAPVFAYDRPGIGQSEAVKDTPTPEWAAEHLRRLLHSLNVAPPYFLVGHSWGGTLNHFFAGLHPTEVVGIVSIDPTDPWMTQDRYVAIFESFGAGLDVYLGWIAGNERELSEAPEAIRVEYSQVFLLREGAISVPQAPLVPTSILVSALYDPPPPSVELPFEWEDFHAPALDDRITHFAEQIGKLPEGELIVTSSAQHFIHHDDPALVINVITRLIERLNAESEGRLLKATLSVGSW